MRISDFPTEFKADFGLFWPFPACFGRIGHWSIRTDMADTARFWPNQPDSERIEADSTQIEPRQRESSRVGPNLRKKKKKKKLRRSTDARATTLEAGAAPSQPRPCFLGCNALPTKQALMKRKIAANSICERCKSAVEEAEHALWSCLELEVVWADREVWCFRSKVGFSDVKELVSWLIAKGKPLELFAYTAWKVWNQRNKARLNLQVIPLHQVADQAKELLAQYRVNLQVPKVQLMNSGSRGSRWRCPQVGLVKINFDGAVCSEANMSGIGVVIKDDKGAVLASCSEKIPRAYKADEIEALVTMKALSFAFELGFWSAILEGDSLGLIQALKSEEQSLAPTGLLIEDVKMFANNYVRLLYSHIKRNGNRVAHNLAKNALRIPDFQV